MRGIPCFVEATYEGSMGYVLVMRMSKYMSRFRVKIDRRKKRCCLLGVSSEIPFLSHFR